ERAAQQAIAASQALFGRGDLAELDDATVAAAVSGLPSVAARVGDAVVDVLAATDVFRGRSDARRAVAEGGVYVNNLKVTSAEARRRSSSQRSLAELPDSRRRPVSSPSGRTPACVVRAAHRCPRLGSVVLRCLGRSR